MLTVSLRLVIGGGNDELDIGVEMSLLRHGELTRQTSVFQVQGTEALNGTPDWRVRDSGVFLRVAGVSVVLEPEVEEAAYLEVGEGSAEGEAPPEGGIDGLIIEATEHWGVEWAADELAYVRFKESSNIVVPCKVGDSGERGPYQFMAGTWASTPYADLDPCDLEAATFAAAWFVSVGRWLEWTCWPR